jgi:hypothetical protein
VKKLKFFAPKVILGEALQEKWDLKIKKIFSLI